MPAKSTSMQTTEPPEAPTLPRDGYVTWNRLKPHVPMSRETVRKLENAGRFPRRTRLSENVTAWHCPKIHKWMADPPGYYEPAAEVMNEGAS